VLDSSCLCSYLLGCFHGVSFSICFDLLSVVNKCQFLFLKEVNVNELVTGIVCLEIVLCSILILLSIS